MKNVYDVLVNFKKVAYEFYEWSKSDAVEHIKIIPSFRVDERCLVDFTENNVKIEEDFLKRIENKTEVFSNRLVKVIEYACIFFNDEMVLATEFDKKGNIIGRSKLLFDEADDVIASGYDLDKVKVNYQIISRQSYERSFTRKESNVIMALCNYLDSVFSKNQNDELKYMYFECFDKDEEDGAKAYQHLKKHVMMADLDVINRLKSLIKVLKK